MFRFLFFCVSCGLVLAMCGVAAVAGPITVPTSLNPGDQYRLAFLTAGTIDATSSDIETYNTFVTAEANLQTELAALGTSWKAIGSTATVDARDNTGTNPNVSGGVKIFLLNDTKLVDNNADLWDGSIDTPLGVKRDGSLNEDPRSQSWTGTDLGGTKMFEGTQAQFLGSPAGVSWNGSPVLSDTAWLLHTRRGVLSQNHFMYAVSDVLTVPQAAIPEPSTLVLLVCGLLGLWGLSRYTQRRKKGKKAVS